MKRHGLRPAAGMGWTAATLGSADPRAPFRRQRHARRDHAEFRARQGRDAGPQPLALGEHEPGDRAVELPGQRDCRGV